MTLDNAAKDRSAKTPCAVNCLIRIASTMLNKATGRPPRNRVQFNTYVDCVDENRRRKKVSRCCHTPNNSGFLLKCARAIGAAARRKMTAEMIVDFGAGEGIRTLDPNLGKVVLYP